MTSEEIRYESKTVRTVRGAEARAKAKWEQAGWEFVEQSPDSMLRTKLVFRKRAPKRPPLVVLAGLGVLLIVGVSLAAFFEEDDPADQTASEPSVTATVERSNLPTDSPSGAATDQPSESAVDGAVSAEEKPSPEPTVEDAVSAPDTSPSATAQTITVENNEEFVALLAETVSGGAAVEAFATTYDGALLEFDANIVDVAPHDGYQTRFDILISGGDFSPTSRSGPNFQFQDVNVTNDLKLKGPGVPDSIGTGQNVRIIARIAGYNPVQELFFLEPVSTQIR